MTDEAIVAGINKRFKSSPLNFSLIERPALPKTNLGSEDYLRNQFWKNVADWADTIDQVDKIDFYAVEENPFIQKMRHLDLARAAFLWMY